MGWWWVVGGVWYFYPSPVYPYPSPWEPPPVVIASPPAGANQSAYNAVNAQRRYDIAYQQCMHAKGNLVSGSGYAAHGWAPPAAVPAPPPVQR